MDTEICLATVDLEALTERLPSMMTTPSPRCRNAAVGRDKRHRRAKWWLSSRSGDWCQRDHEHAVDAIFVREQVTPERIDAQLARVAPEIDLAADLLAIAVDHLHRRAALRDDEDAIAAGGLR